MDRDEEIRSIAYRLWEDEGRPVGCELEHWLKAEAIWREREKSQVQAASSDSSAQVEERKRASPAKRPRQRKPKAVKVTPANQ